MLGTRKFRTPEARTRALRVRVAYTVGSVVGVACVIALVVVVLRQPFLAITAVSVTGAGPERSDAILTVASEYLQGSLFGIIPRGTAYTMRTAALEARVLAVLPRLESAEVLRSGLHKIVIRVAEREAVLLWCGDVVPPVATADPAALPRTEEVWGTCYLMDRNGLLYARAPVYTGSVYPRTYGPLPDSEPIRSRVFDAQEVERIKRLFDLLAQIELPARALLVADETDSEVYLDAGVVVRTLRDADPNDVVNRLRAMWEHGIEPERDLEYVDLRFGNKAFVRYRGEQPTTEDAPTLE